MPQFTGDVHLRRNFCPWLSPRDVKWHLQAHFFVPLGADGVELEEDDGSRQQNDHCLQPRFVRDELKGSEVGKRDKHDHKAVKEHRPQLASRLVVPRIDVEEVVPTHDEEANEVAGHNCDRDGGGCNVGHPNQAHDHRVSRFATVHEALRLPSLVPLAPRDASASTAREGEQVSHDVAKDAGVGEDELQWHQQQRSKERVIRQEIR
mmetsp:Transcript_11237/g.28467  ORF Transcript_11237/g.28467 Transcript_11237/m.28467 type:complete len:206 (+) Transcript_11237:134-751(+)